MSFISNITNTIVNQWKNITTGVTSYFFSTTGQNLYTTGYNIQGIPIATPFGYFSMPTDNTQYILLQVNNSPKSFIAVNANQAFPITPENLPFTFQKGDIAQIEGQVKFGYSLRAEDGFKGYQFPNDVNATLPQGEWLGKYILDRISDIETFITDFNNHTHSYIPGSNPATNTAIPTQQITPFPDLATDKTSINNEEYLFNNNGVPLS